QLRAIVGQSERCLFGFCRRRASRSKLDPVPGSMSSLSRTRQAAVNLDVRHFRVVPRADIDAPVPPSICRANRGGAEAHGRVACARTLRGADADAAPKTRPKPSTGSQIGKGCTLRQSKAVTPDIPM